MIPWTLGKVLEILQFITFFSPTTYLVLSAEAIRPCPQRLPNVCAEAENRQVSLGSMPTEEAKLSRGHHESRISLAPCDSLGKSLPFLGISFLTCERMVWVLRSLGPYDSVFTVACGLCFLC